MFRRSCCSTRCAPSCCPTTAPPGRSAPQRGVPALKTCEGKQTRNGAFACFRRNHCIEIVPMERITTWPWRALRSLDLATTRRSGFARGRWPRWFDGRRAAADHARCCLRRSRTDNLVAFVRECFAQYGRFDLRLPPRGPRRLGICGGWGVAKNFCLRRFLGRRKSFGDKSHDFNRSEPCDHDIRCPGELLMIAIGRVHRPKAVNRQRTTM